MHEVEIKQGKQKHIIKFFDSDRLLTIRRYQRFNKFLMIDLGVGDSIEDYRKRGGRSLGYIRAEDYKSAETELINRENTLHHALEEYSPKGMALAVMVHSINGHQYEDFEESTLNKIQDKLDEIGFTKLLLDETVTYLKKKLRKK